MHQPTNRDSSVLENYHQEFHLQNMNLCEPINAASRFYHKTIGLLARKALNCLRLLDTKKCRGDPLHEYSVNHTLSYFIKSLSKSQGRY